MDEKQAQEHAQQLADALIKAVASKNEELAVKLIQTIMKPMMERMEHIGIAQVALANGLRQARRDRNATEFAQTMLRSFLDKGGLPDQNQLHVVADTAYAVAREMEVHALVHEAQSATLKERVEKHVKEKPGHDAGAAALSFLKRTSVPRLDD